MNMADTPLTVELVHLAGALDHDGGQFCVVCGLVLWASDRTGFDIVKNVIQTQKVVRLGGFAEGANVLEIRTTRKTSDGRHARAFAVVEAQSTTCGAW